MSSVNQAFAQRAKEEKISNRSYLYNKINVEQKDINLTTGSHTEETTLVRARDEKGHYVKDDLSTPDVNEAWVEKPKVKPKAKKKVAKKV
jgi:hypothetical protein|tara:strand:+ start:117 stop:386 length:270 start_codon:yes stop_codon:yes gene_type:complete